MFVFTDRVWDELEDAQDQLDNSNAQVASFLPEPEAAAAETAETAPAAAETENNPLNSDNVGVETIQHNCTNPQTTDEYTYKIVEDESQRANYSSLIGVKFKDREENKNFVIHNICSCSSHRNEELFYMYYNIERLFLFSHLYEFIFV